MSYRLPNGYGSVVKLSGRRRRPYAVRITDKYELVDGHVIQKYKYLEYFEKRKDAILYLANYNSGMRVKEHQSIQEQLSFSEVYKKWLEERESSKKGVSHSLKNSYNAAFAKFSQLHKKKMRNIRLADVQPIFTANREMSRGTIVAMKTVIRGMYHYAMRYELVDQDFTPFLIAESADIKQIHKPFTAEEIRTLWEHSSDDVAQFALITIYTGMRPGELLAMPSASVNLDGHYMVGGSKTDAGKNRTIPIHNRIMPLVETRMRDEYLFYGGKLKTAWYNRDYKKYMQDLGMPHLPHDGRHTCATLMEAAGVPIARRKRILGHAMGDITEGVYTHVEPSILVQEINKIVV